MSTPKKIGRFLEERVRKDGTDGVIYYNTLAANFDLPEIDERWLQHPLHKIFDVLDLEDAENDRPFRTVLVIRKRNENRDEEMPGPGFFRTVLALRNPRPRLRTDMDKLIFFSQELLALADYYRGTKS